MATIMEEGWPGMAGHYVLVEVTSYGSNADRDCPGDPGEFEVVGWGRTEASRMEPRERRTKRLDLGEDLEVINEAIMDRIEEERHERSMGW